MRRRKRWWAEIFRLFPLVTTLCALTSLFLHLCQALHRAVAEGVGDGHDNSRRDGQAELDDRCDVVALSPVAAIHAHLGVEADEGPVVLSRATARRMGVRACWLASVRAHINPIEHVVGSGRRNQAKIDGSKRKDSAELHCTGVPCDWVE